MAQNKPIRFGPVALSNTLTTNIINTAITSLAGPVGYTQTQPYVLITSIQVVNKTATLATFSLWIGATGANSAGTEWFNAQPVAGNSFVIFYVRKRLDSGDFLVGGASLATTLTFQADGEIGLS